MRELPRHTALAVHEIPAAPEPLAACELLREGSHAWLLDSAQRSSHLGRFSFAGVDPWLVLRARGERVELEVRRAVAPGFAPGRHSCTGDFFGLARALLPRLPRGAGPAALPFVGGAVGALGYELGERTQPVRLGGLDDLGLPDAALLFVDRLLAWDHAKGRCYALSLGFASDPPTALESAEAGTAQLRALLDRGPRAAPARRGGARPGAASGAPQVWFDEAAYGKAVDAVKQEIAAGNVYQANLSQRLERRFAGDAWELYRALRRLNPAPFACFLELPEVCIVGSSPERFVRVDHERRVESRPIKGTRPRGRHAAEDALLRDALASSPKDRAENLMIVDLVRNDLGRVCEIGSIEVPELMVIEEYAAVFQMVSTVTGRLRSDCDAFDLVRATFPPGSMTGAPKIAAMEILSRLEPVRRGIYSGAIGWFDARGGCDLSVVIRTILAQGTSAYVHAGGGIVADSDPREEWRETLDKARPLLGALDEVS